MGESMRYQARGSATTNYWRPPNPNGPEHLSIPLWEKKFCSYVCSIPWRKICETKRFMCMYKNIVEWNDSAALEAFQNAKARFWAEYHGRPCEIPLPDPDMFIDKVDPDARIDPELLADLEKRPHVSSDGVSAAPNGWDSFIFANKPVPATGWGDAEQNETSDQHNSSNWNIWTEQPIQDTGWWDVAEPYSAGWDVHDNSCKAWNHHGHGWFEGPLQHDSWGGGVDNCGINDWSGSLRHENRNNRPSRRHNRKRDGGGRFSSSFTKPKYQLDGHQSNNSWRNCRGRNDTNYPCDKTGGYT
ncbi:uncharacterized protein [Typha angustifolia]|uniref:uncharacterized protein n=1 Tax=Typha angustifolia TaxID=59011 RepID=UPI003C2F98B9